MTAEQMKYEFEVAYDRISNFEAPGYTEKEISTFLTKAQEQVVFELYKGADHYKENVKKSLSMLRTVSDLSVFVSGPYPNSFLSTIPSDVLVVYNETADFTTSSEHDYPSASLTDVHVKPIDDDFYHINKQNPFKKPSVKMVWRIDHRTTTAKEHLYVFDKYCTPSKVKLFYYKKPEPIIIEWSSYVEGDGSIDDKNWSAYTTASLDCALDPIIHRDIVDKAVQLAFAASKDDKGFQISAVQEQQKK